MKSLSIYDEINEESWLRTKKKEMSDYSLHYQNHFYKNNISRVE